MKRVATVIAGIAAALLAPPLAAQGPAPATAERPAKIAPIAFAKGSGISQMNLSPDGNAIALRAVSAGRVSVAIVDAATHAPKHRLQLPESNTLEWFDWAGNGKLLLAMSAQTVFFDQDVRVSRLYYYDLATGKTIFVGTKNMGLDGDELLYTDPAGAFVLLSIQRTIYDYPSVWRFPLDAAPGKSAREVQKARTNVWDWYADSAGVVRMGFQYLPSKKLKIWYRKGAADEFREIAKLTEETAEDGAWDVLRIVSGSDQGLVLKPDDSGRIAVRKFDYASRTTGEVVYSAPGWDVTSAWFDDHDQLIAAFYTDDRDQVVWFDQDMKVNHARLQKALKGSDVWVTSRATDDSRMIVWTGHEDDPGGYYVYTAAKKTLDPFSSELPDLDPAQLATPKPVGFTARDGTAIRGYLTLPRGRDPKALPLIILPHGGPFGVRDKLEYSSEVQFLANRGYAVLQPNFRGSDGYGDAFDQLGRGQIGRAMQDDIDDAMDWAVKEGIADPKRVCVVGASYGGYAALWGVIRNPERYRCAASFAGVTDWNRQLKYDAAFFTRKGAKKWRASVQGSDASFDLDLVSPVQQVARLTRPVLLTHGDADTNVPMKQFRMMEEAAKKAGKPLETLVFAGEGHGFDNPDNQAKWYAALEAFLARHNPAD